MGGCLLSVNPVADLRLLKRTITVVDEHDPSVPRPHPLEIPFVWFAILLAEAAIFVPLIRALIPRTTPAPLAIAIWIVALGALTAMNYAIRRRFIPR